MSDSRYVIGILSGTSMDAVDCILADFSTPIPTLLCTYSAAYPDDLRQDVLALCADQPPTWRILGETDIRLGRLFASAINSLLEKANIKAGQVIAIGSHGQTIQHHPDACAPFTMQIGDPNTIAAQTGITTVADFRRKDMANGGQGAPLAPLFHQACFSHPERTRVILNLGGIANISILGSASNPVLRGFDTGPANVLMDIWTQLHTGESFDTDGRWAAQGTVDSQLLETFLKETYFQLPSPKSTGRELFNQKWLENKLSTHGMIAPVNVQRTLLELTVQTVIRSIKTAAPDCQELIVCGGGVRNKTLQQRFQELLGSIKVQSSAELGIPAEWVEAMTFAWIAEQTMRGKVIDCRSVTGARTPSILGGIYLADKQHAKRLK